MKRSKKEGFTLLELIATIAIFVIVASFAISMITMGIRYNSINRTTYNSDIYIKSLFETIKVKGDANRPKKQVLTGGAVTQGIPNASYYLSFNSTEDEIVRFVTNEFSKEDTASKTALANRRITNNPDTHLNDAITEVNGKVANKEYGMIIKIQWDTTNEVYSIDTWCWNQNKGQISLVNRKMLIRARA